MVNFINILRAHFRQYSLAKKVQTLNISTNNLGTKLLYKKAARKMLMKLTPGVSTNIINTKGCCEPKKVEKHFIRDSTMNNMKLEAKKASFLSVIIRKVFTGIFFTDHEWVSKNNFRIHNLKKKKKKSHIAMLTLYFSYKP